MLIDTVVPRDNNVITGEAGKIFKITYNRDVAYAEYTNETHTSDNKDTWNHLNINHKISRPHTCKA
jgi:hypothetical protein